MELNNVGFSSEMNNDSSIYQELAGEKRKLRLLFSSR